MEAQTKRIILAAGHGGGDSGATGQGTTEAAEVIDIVNRAAQKLKADGQVEVIVVPHELNLKDQIDWVNARYDSLDDGYALEVHKNATVNAHGVEGWYYHDDEQSKNLMAKVTGFVSAVAGLTLRGNFPDTQNRWGSLGWIEETNTAAGLLECGFVSDGGDPVGPVANDKYAQGIFEGVLALWGLMPVPAPVVKIPAQAQVAYRVYDNAKQIGAYNVRLNAWFKYRDGGGVKIVDSNGVDVTTSFINEFRPTESPTWSNPHPELATKEEVAATNARVGALEGIVAKIRELLAKWGINL